MMNLKPPTEPKSNGKKVKTSPSKPLKKPKKIKNLEPKELSPKKFKTILSSISSKTPPSLKKKLMKMMKKLWP